MSKAVFCLSGCLSRAQCVAVEIVCSGGERRTKLAFHNAPEPTIASTALKAGDVSLSHQLGQLQPMPPMRDFIAVGYLVCVILRDAQRRSDFTFGKVVKSRI